MILWISGVRGSGKSTLTKKVLKSLGSPVKFEHEGLTAYNFNDILFLGRYKGRITGLGTFYCSKDNFINYVTAVVNEYKHILIEGHKYITTLPEIFEAFDKISEFKMIYLETDISEITRRRRERARNKEKKIEDSATISPLSRYDSILNNPSTLIRRNDDMHMMKKTHEEIMKMLSI